MQHALGTTKSQLVFNLELIKSSSCFSRSREADANETRPKAVKLRHLIFFPYHSSELQLKTRHQPYKLCRQWNDLLYRFTDASEEDISQGDNDNQTRTSH